jgi:hypothetical protein
MTVKNALIIGCGSLYGKDLSQSLQNKGYAIYGISGTTTPDQNILTVDWNACVISDFEKFLRKLPCIDLIVFNQNSPALTDNYNKLNSLDIFEVWKRAKKWSQSHYVNCILPTHLLHTLVLINKVNNHTCITWMLSNSMFGKDQLSPVDYVGQKYQNYIMMKTLALNNPQIFIGINPGKIDATNSVKKAKNLADFLFNNNKDYSGKLFSQTDDSIVDNKLNFVV